jgi:hypothetical protein
VVLRTSNQQEEELWLDSKMAQIMPKVKGESAESPFPVFFAKHVARGIYSNNRRNEEEIDRKFFLRGAE